MQISRRVVVLLIALALGMPAAASAQTATIPQGGTGVSTQPPVTLGDDEQDETDAKPSETPGTAELPNTGSDPRLLFLVGVALTLFGVGLRLRTADADVY